MLRCLTYTLMLFFGASPAVLADQVISDDLIVQSDLCVGAISCIDGEAFGNVDIKIKSNRPQILLDDIAQGDSDWLISGDDDLSGGTDAFSIGNTSTSSTPFTIDASAPSSAVFISNSGAVGLGTVLPQAELHITDSFTPTLRLERTASLSGAAESWDVTNTVDGFSVKDNTVSRTPFILRNAAPSSSLVVSTEGNVGLGVFSPEGKLHTKGDGVQLAYFESGDGDAVQVRFRTDSENRRFLAVNNANEVKTQMQFRDDAILFLGQTVAQEWLRVDATGITTAGPTCGSPCDLTFDPDHFTVPPIDERAAYMWENMHLPAVGPTKPGEPVNLTEKVGGMLHELEVAHIYIEELHGRLEAQDARIRALEAALTAQ